MTEKIIEISGNGNPTFFLHSRANSRSPLLFPNNNLIQFAVPPSAVYLLSFL
jgi:hypothetical protein